MAALLQSPSRLRSHHLLLLAALGLSACAGDTAVAVTEPRRYQQPTADALPEADPTARGTTYGSKTLTETEQLTVRMGRDASGLVVVLGVVSPQLTPEQEREVARAFQLGAWKREVPISAAGESWIETIVRVK